MIRAAILSCVLPFAAMAQEAGFPLDFPALFEAHAADVMQATPGTRRLELPGPVVVEEVTRGGRVSYTATDQSGLGAVGCNFFILAEVLVYGAQCPDVLDDPRKQRLERMLRRMAGFIAVNTYPPIPEDEAETRLRTELRALGAAREGAYTCGAETEQNGSLIFMARAVTEPAVEANLDVQLSVPRLPVTHPCL